MKSLTERMNKGWTWEGGRRGEREEGGRADERERRQRKRGDRPGREEESERENSDSFTVCIIFTRMYTCRLLWYNQYVHGMIMCIAKVRVWYVALLK